MSNLRIIKARETDNRDPAARSVRREEDSGAMAIGCDLVQDPQGLGTMTRSDPVKALEKFLRDNNVQIKFGLVQQGHIPTIERMLADGATWDEIGEVIHWEPTTAKRYYENYKAVRP